MTLNQALQVDSYEVIWSLLLTRGDFQPIGTNKASIRLNSNDGFNELQKVCLHEILRTKEKMAGFIAYVKENGYILTHENLTLGMGYDSVDFIFSSIELQLSDTRK